MRTNNAAMADEEGNVVKSSLSPAQSHEKGNETLSSSQEFSLQIRSKLVNQMINHAERDSRRHPFECLPCAAIHLGIIGI